MVDTKRTKSALIALTPDNTTGDFSNQDMRDVIESVYPSGVILASAYGVATGNSASANTSALQSAVTALLASSTESVLLLDWIGQVDINDEILIADIAGTPSTGGQIMNKTIRGLSMWTTRIRQTDNTKAAFVWRCNAGADTVAGTGVSSAYSFAGCSMTDMEIGYQTQPTRAAGQRAYCIAWENQRRFGRNAMFFCVFDRLWLGASSKSGTAGGFVGIGIRPNEYEWQPGMTLTLNQRILPSPTARYAGGFTHAWKVTTLGNASGGTVEPAWAQNGSTTAGGTGSTAVFTDEGGGDAVGSYMTAWNIIIAPTVMRIHDSTQTAIKWLNGGGVGQPENTLGSVYIQDAGISSFFEPAVELENVEISMLSLGIEDHDNQLIRCNGDEQVVINLLHYERNDFTSSTPADRSGNNLNQSFFVAKANSVVISALRAYNMNANSQSGNLFDFRGAGILSIKSLITSGWSSYSSTVVVRDSGAGAPDSWEINHHELNGLAISLVASSANNAADALDNYNGNAIGGTVRLVPPNLSVAVSTTGQTTFTFASTSYFPDPASVGSYAGYVGNEQILITAKTSTTLTVSRAQNGTAAATYAIGIPVTYAIPVLRRNVRLAPTTNVTGAAMAAGIAQGQTEQVMNPTAFSWQWNTTDSVARVQYAAFASIGPTSTAVFQWDATLGLWIHTGIMIPAGGTVTQATSKSTGVTLNTPTGKITMNSAALAAAAEVSFVVTCAAIGANDRVSVVLISGATVPADYTVTVVAVSAGSFTIAVGNQGGSSRSDTLVLGYSIFKADDN